MVHRIAELKSQILPTAILAKRDGNTASSHRLDIFKDLFLMAVPEDRFPIHKNFNFQIASRNEGRGEGIAFSIIMKICRQYIDSVGRQHIVALKIYRLRRSSPFPKLPLVS